MNNLEFVATEDMIKELQSRFDELVLIASAQRTQQTEDLTVAFSGSYHSCVGLIELGRIAIQAGGSTSDEEYTS